MNEFFRSGKDQCTTTSFKTVRAYLFPTIVAVAFLLLMASSSWANPITYPMAIADIEIDDTLPANAGLLINIAIGLEHVDDVTTVERLIPAGETPGAILLTDFLNDISYAGFFDPAVVAGQFIPGSFGLFRFDLGLVSVTSANEISGSRTSNAVIFGDDPFSDYSLLTVLEGTLQFTDSTIVTSTYAFLDVNTIADSAPEPVPEPGTLLLLGCGLTGLAWHVRRRKGR